MADEWLTRTLHRMEQIREEIGEADTPAEAKRLRKEYARLWELVKPSLPA